MEFCKTCKLWMPLKPGLSGICRLKQRDREWNEGMAVTGDDDTCDDHAPIRLTDAPPRYAANL